MFDFILADTFDISMPPHEESVLVSQQNDVWNYSLSDIAYKHLAAMSEDELDSDWKFNEFFGTVTVINLPQAEQRLKSVSEEFRNIGTEFEIFRAIDGCKELEPSIWQKIDDNRDGNDISTEEGRLAQDRFLQGAAGCYMSHYRLIQRIKDCFDRAMIDLYSAQEVKDENAIEKAYRNLRKYSSVLIIEDDCGFGIVNNTNNSADRKGVGVQWRKTLCDLPDDWDILYLMTGAKQPSEEVSHNLRKLKGSFGTVAYAIKYTMYGPLIEHLKKIEDPAIKKVDPIDHELSSIQPLYNVYAVYPSIAFQHCGQSYISANSSTTLFQGQPVLP